MSNSYRTAAHRSKNKNAKLTGTTISGEEISIFDASVIIED